MTMLTITVMMIMMLMMMMVITIMMMMMMTKADRPKSLNSRRSIVAEEKERDEDQSAESRDEQLPR